MADKLSVMPDADYIDACNAIREKDGSTGPIKSGEMGGKIRAIPSGGGGECEAMLDRIIDRSITEIKNDRVKSIGSSAFRSCSELTTVDFPTVTSIGSYAFQSCSELTTVDFPTVTSIGSYAFSTCSKLTTVDFPTVTSIGNYAFQYCSKLTTADLPAATSIGSSAFRSCSELTTVDFPTVTSIGSYAFSTCSELTALRLSGPTLCKATGDPKINPTCKIYVPASLIDQYKVATNWSKYATQFVAIEGV